MTEETKVQEVIEEIKNADEETLKSTIEKWYETTRAGGMKIGAIYIAAAVDGMIRKHLKKGYKPSLRDYERCIKDINKIVSVQLAKQNVSEEQDDVTEDDKA